MLALALLQSTCTSRFCALFFSFLVVLAEAVKQKMDSQAAFHFFNGASHVISRDTKATDFEFLHLHFSAQQS